MQDELRDRLGVSEAQIAEFCQRWQLTELSVFGSVLRDDFRPDSDIDLLVGYAPDVRRRLVDHARMEEELAEMLGRKIDLCSKLGVEHSRNWIIRNNILDSAEIVYESR
jgi:predicted nucleotidyltransferase